MSGLGALYMPLLARRAAAGAPWAAPEPSAAPPGLHALPRPFRRHAPELQRFPHFFRRSP